VIRKESAEESVPFTSIIHGRSKPPIQEFCCSIEDAGVRVGARSVTMFKDYEIVREYHPPQLRNELF
jgi:hypothetical protein